MKIIVVYIAFILIYYVITMNYVYFEDKNSSLNKFNLSDDEIQKNAFSFFQKYTVEHSKSYSTIEEFKKRFKIFLENLYKIKSLQERDSEAAYNINFFSDLSTEEFANTYLMKDFNEKSESPTIKNSEVELKTSLEDLPNSLDWREKGVVTAVKDQSTCGCCWAFSAVQTVESHYAIKTGKLFTLSEQQLLDCDLEDHSCGGGLHYRGLNYIAKEGLAEEKEYPYKKRRYNCTVSEKNIVANITGYKNITSDEIEMQKALYELGPISVGLDATSIQFYFGGVTDPWLCSSTNNHAVVIVGYGKSFFGTDYWLIKNSWGSWWGESGYFRLVRGKSKCGITKAPSVPIL